MTSPRTDAAAAPFASVQPDPAKIIVPRKHGEVLIEPPLSVLEQFLLDDSARENAATGLDFAGHPLATLRAKARAHFLAAAKTWAANTGAAPPRVDALDKPWILTGHQLEFYHAGVWAKVLAADALADRAHAVAFDLLVDHDVVDEFGFHVPEQRGDQWSRPLVAWSTPSGMPAEALPAPDSAAFEKWDAELAANPHTHTDSLAFFLASLKPQGQPTSYSRWLAAARAKFEAALNVHVHHVPTSLLCAGEAWQTFVRAWIDNAAEWIPIYNSHLAAYRQRQGIKNPHHPMPDLAHDADTFELPFWIYKLGQPRQRLLIQKTSSHIAILHDALPHKLDQLVAPTSDLLIRPRALALTMYARLFLADLFIHGIGGALYDQITDGIMAQLFHRAPAYACVSAAWLLPLGIPLEGNDEIAALKSRRHHARHNPHLFLDPFTSMKPAITETIRERRHLIDQIANSLAARRRDPVARQLRAAWFQQLHAKNISLHRTAPRILESIHHDLTQAQKANEQNKVLLHREYFFALHTMESLQKLIATIHAPPI